MASTLSIVKRKSLTMLPRMWTIRKEMRDMGQAGDYKYHGSGGKPSNHQEGETEQKMLEKRSAVKRKGRSWL